MEADPVTDPAVRKKVASLVQRLERKVVDEVAEADMSLIP